jgi:sec-independent protein translocase protein TatA
MGLRDLFEGPHLVILTLVIVALFGWKRLPDAARSLGRSMRIFKSEVNEMKSDGNATSSDASRDTVNAAKDHPSAEPDPETDPRLE